MALARAAHGDQCRDDGSPYLEEHVFPIAAQTAEYVVDRPEIEQPEGAVVVALLHDVLEDSSHITSAALRSTFGPEIATAVQLLTKPRPRSSPGGDGGKGADREEQYMARIASAPFIVRLVKVLDRLNNLACVHKSPPGKRSVYIDETRRFHLPLSRMIDPGLAEAMETRLRELSATLEA